MKSSEVDDDGELTGIRRSFNVEVICSPFIEDGTSHTSHESHESPFPISKETFAKDSFLFI